MYRLNPRVLNFLVGLWLFISAFLWPHSSAQAANTWIVGLLCMVFALLGLVAPPARYINAALAVWLFASTFAMHALSAGTRWNNVLVSIVMFFIAVTPPPLGRFRGRGPSAPSAA